MGNRDRLPRYQVTWWGYFRRGATREHGEKCYYFRAASDRAAVDDARDAMRNEGVEPDGPPSVVMLPES